MEALIVLLLLAHLNKGALKPGMTGILQIGSKPFGVVAVVASGGALGWTNVLPKENANLRQITPPGTSVLIRSGERHYRAVRDGDGMQGGPFFRAV